MSVGSRPFLLHTCVSTVQKKWWIGLVFLERVVSNHPFAHRTKLSSGRSVSAFTSIASAYAEGAEQRARASSSTISVGLGGRVLLLWRVVLEVSIGVGVSG